MLSVHLCVFSVYSTYYQTLSITSIRGHLSIEARIRTIELCRPFFYYFAHSSAPFTFLTLKSGNLSRMGEIDCLSGLSIKRGPTIHMYVGTPVDMYVIHLYLRIIYTSLCAVLTFVFVGVGIIVRIHMYLFDRGS